MNQKIPLEPNAPAVDWAVMPERRSHPGAAGPEFQEEIHRLLLSQYTPSAVLVEDSLNIVHVHGDVRPFLEAPNGASPNVMSLAKGDLAAAVRAAILKAKCEDRPVKRAAGHRIDGRDALVSVDVLPVRGRRDRRRRYLVLFKALNEELAAAKEQLHAANERLVAVNEELRDGIAALEASRDYAEAIVDTVNDSLLILNRHLKIKRASRLYYKLFQTSAAEVEGRSIYEIGGGRWNVRALRENLSALTSRRKPFVAWESEFEVPRLGRRTLALSGRIVPHRVESETSVVLAIEDVSLRKQAAEAAALRKSEAHQREFVANVSHELMTPITAIKGYSESLVAGALEIPAKRVKFTQIIEKHADRLAQLVEDLLQLSTFDAGRASAPNETVGLRSAFDKLVRGLAPVARARAVSIRVLVPEALRVSINRSELGQVIRNLCENAVKYNRQGGRVLVRARTVGKRAVVSVKDTGIGVPREDLPRIFDRFHRAENARRKTARGNGLGLSIARSILGNRGCRIWAESEEGKGTTFFFTLPLADGTSSRRRATVTRPR